VTGGKSTNVLGARYYTSSFGRFLSPDWSAKVEPVPYAKLDNPQTLNLYLYAGDNPESVFDPDGHQGKKAAGNQVVQTGQCTLDSPCGHKKVKVTPPNAKPPNSVKINYDKGVPAMSAKTAKYVKKVLNAAKIRSVKISATTNGKHATHSWHYKGKAVDIHVVNGTRVIYYSSNASEKAAVDAIQTAANDKSNGVAHENYGPASLFKNGKQISNATLQKQHLNHIHLTVPNPGGS
jgi:RHS repeat-associated protein